MNRIVQLTKFVKFYCIHILLTVFCIIHIAFIGYDIVNPEIPEIKTFKTDLGISFPLSFSVCVETREIVMDNGNRVYEQGYEDELNFFYGKSRFNSSIIGWAGHTENGSTLSTVKGNMLIPLRSHERKTHEKHLNNAISRVAFVAENDS